MSSLSAPIPRPLRFLIESLAKLLTEESGSLATGISCSSPHGVVVDAGQRRRGRNVSGQDAFAEGLLLFVAGHSFLLGM